MERGDQDSGGFAVLGRRLKCMWCAGEGFESRRGVMDTRDMTFLGMGEPGLDGVHLPVAT
ncbi:MAG: hypothetical protein ABR562_04605 [Thermoplasmatota archaeon]|nr:hypothetical protein [Halobacteriales archaeon]